MLSRTQSRPFPVLLAALLAIVVAGVLAPPAISAAEAGMSFEQLAAVRQVGRVAMAPDGSAVAYTLGVPRDPGRDKDGPSWTELHLLELATGHRRGFVTGEVNVSSPAFSPDGRLVYYLAKRDDNEKRALWAIPRDGGESRLVFEFKENISAFDVSPDGKRLAFVAVEPEPKEHRKLEKKGYNQNVFEEDWRPRRLYLLSLPPFDPPVPEPGAEPEKPEPRALELEGSVFAVQWAPGGQRLVVTVAPRPLVDDSYMKQRVRVVNASDGSIVARVDNPGKLGDVRISPDGRHVALIAGEDVNDPREGRLMVAPAAGGALRDLLPGFLGHVTSMAWQDADTVMFTADVGVQTLVGEVSLSSGAPKALHQPAPLLAYATGGDDRKAPPAGAGPVLYGLQVSRDGRHAAFVGHDPMSPREVWTFSHGDPAPSRRTFSNPWLEAVPKVRQEVFTWKSRDGLELQGMLLRPMDGPAPAPLVLMVHGGPEAHDTHGWLTSYSRPGQLMAARGFAVLYPNYRGSTGRGVAFSKLGQADAAGKEFDDLVDAVDALVAAGVADRDRVGITGGSYGGYATAWCSTRHSHRFKAGVMFVGISNVLSKGLTTDIPEENYYSHALYWPWERWQFNLERSPIYYAEQSRTALLIAGGTADTRVHPSQSLQLYRILKLLGRTPVRYVRYPGEPHGNRRAAARDDYARRLVRWFEHYLQGPGGEPPPVELPEVARRVQDGGKKNDGD